MTGLILLALYELIVHRIICMAMYLSGRSTSTLLNDLWCLCGDATTADIAIHRHAGLRVSLKPQVGLVWALGLVTEPRQVGKGLRTIMPEHSIPEEMSEYF